MTLLAHITAITLLTWGVFYFIRDNFPRLQNYRKWYTKPLWGCIICAASFWGSVAYWLLPEPTIGGWLVTVGAVSGLNFFLAHWFEIEWKELNG